MDISALKRDRAKAAAGQWVDDIPGLGDARLRVRGLKSPAVIEAITRKERAVPRSKRERDGSIRSEDGVRILKDVLADIVLIDWQGFTDNGVAVPYDADTAKAWITNPDLEDFAEAVVWAAKVVDLGHDAARDESIKN